MRRYNLVHFGCWAHLRRYFIKAEENVRRAARSTIYSRHASMSTALRN
ncbi:IS66 family transposase [Paraburkholderia sp. RL17-373-BIF-A]